MAPPASDAGSLRRRRRRSRPVFVCGVRFSLPLLCSVIDENPLWFPQSFFARTLWLVLIVVLFSKALTWFIC
jgi:hypothetical protein